MKALKAQEQGVCKTLFEAELAVQEWGVRNGMRLFGIMIADYEEPEKVNSEMKPKAKAFFTDAGFKNMMIIYFDIKETGGKVSITKSKNTGKGTKWAIKFARTKNFGTDRIDPVCPLYWVLVDRKIILPFKSTMTQKDWLALPFEEHKGLKPTNVF
jgi:hypothetical protein